MDADPTAPVATDSANQPWRNQPTFTPEQLREFQIWVEDKAVRAARKLGTNCSEFTNMMAAIFDEPVDGDQFRDSNGVNCKGHRWFDAAGYGIDGYNANGYDANGFNRDGYNAAGFDANGLDANGLAVDPRRFIYNPRGYTRGGYNVDGADRDGFQRGSVEEAIRFVYDRDGYNRDGYNIDGNDRHGNYVEGKGVRYSDTRAKANAIRWGVLNADGTVPVEA